METDERISNTAKRLKLIMDLKHIKAPKLLELCLPYCEKFNQKIDKSYISKWLSGEYEPNQRKLTILALALEVSEVYLMGYDVPMERPKQEIKEVIEKLRKLDLFDLGKISVQIDVLLESDKYQTKTDKKTA